MYMYVHSNATQTAGLVGSGEGQLAAAYCRAAAAGTWLRCLPVPTTAVGVQRCMYVMLRPCLQGTADFSQLELKGNISSSYNLTVSGARLETRTGKWDVGPACAVVVIIGMALLRLAGNGKATID